jgi:hypothetical protein
VPNFHIEDFDINVSYDAISPTMLWEARFQEFKRVQESHQTYDAMTDDQREALIERVRRATAIMYDTAEEWVPDSLSIHDDGACIRLEFNLVFTNIDVDVDNKHKATTFKLREMREEIEKLINEVDDEA